MVKLSEDEIMAIRCKYKGRGKGPTQQELAEQYGVDRGHIGRIVRGVSWDHLPEE